MAPIGAKGLLPVKTDVERKPLRKVIDDLIHSVSFTRSTARLPRKSVVPCSPGY